ncbi:putative PurR-regulated permease PerM [Novosphingobium chloroacetimidivorans]|uniref:Putative PurR-regulated permease PerM n=1 Tax=Novosphingobium chloroacetimidivorans TaxID=1428314 RepID=A0A7W7K7C1_9SPHN|nr:AI-2E family transporter [Novosphingobium chloroacetimidivorans]MBB4856953.1 putative PurR-regulated permease PerM [Novosphingobium chloroacetimidivorans]
MQAPFKPSPEDLTYLRRLGWTVLIAAILMMAWRASDLLLLAFGSLLGAVMFRSAARLMQRIGVRNWSVAMGLGTLLVLAAFGAIGYLLTVQFGTELGAMLSNLPGTLESIERGLSTTKVGRAVVQAGEAAAGGSKIADSLSDLVRGAGEILLNFVIVMVGAMFIAGNPRPYRNAVVLMTPPPARATMQRALDEMSLALRLWLKAKLITMTIMAVVIGGSLWMAGLESWASLGLLGGLSEFVPYVGPAVAMLPAIGLAASEGGDVVWHTVVAFLAVRVIEGWLLTPFINRSVVSIPPALTLFTILGVGAVFGVYGVFFAGALLVIAFVGVREFYLRDTLGEDIDGVPRD